MKIFPLATLFLLVAALAPGADEIKNGKTPRGKAQTMTFTEDLRFGSEDGDDNYLWALQTTDLAVDAKGHIYVADTKENRILEFDAKGIFVREIAKKGQGPGELSALNSFQILKDGRAVILEVQPMAMPKVQFLDTNLVYERTLNPSFSKFPTGGVFSPDGTRFAGYYAGVDMAANKLVTYSGIMDQNLEILKEVTRNEQTVNFQQMGDPTVLANFIGDLINNAYKGSGIFAYDAQGNLYTAISNQYEITRWNSDLTTPQAVISRDYKPYPNTKEEILALADNLTQAFRQNPFMRDIVTDDFIERVINRLDLPPAKHPVNALFLTPEGHMLVLHNTRLATGEQICDIFDKEGHFIGQVEMDHWAFAGFNPTPRMIFKNGFAYTLETDEDGENQVVRYRYEITPNI
jgi:hypothetical protein